MPDEARTEASDHNTADTQPDDQADTLDPETQRQNRKRVTQLAFGGDPQRFDEFVRVLSEATPNGVEVILRGSAWIRGMVWLSGRDIARSTIEMMQSDGYVDAWRTLYSDHQNDPGYTFPVWDPHVRLDYVFTPAEYASRFTSCEVRRAPEKVLTASDHFPLLVDISDS